MDSVPNDEIQQLTVEEYEDPVETLKATEILCQQLEEWAVGQLSGRCCTRPLHDLVQYCKATSLLCRSYLAGALLFDQNVKPTTHETTMLVVLLAECKRRILDVLDLLENELDRSSRTEPVGRQERPEINITQKYDVQQFITAVTKLHGNTILRSNSQCLTEKQGRTEDKVARQILPSIFVFRSELFKMADGSHGIKSCPDDTYPGERQIDHILPRFLSMSTDWPESLQAITDPLKIPSYETRSYAPYVLGVEGGAGGFGTVYKAHNTKTHATVAVKRLSGIYTTKMQNTVRKELGMLQICDHPNIVKFLDAYQISDQPDTFYLVMEPWAPYTLYKFLHQSDSQRCHDSPWFTQGSHSTERQVTRIFRGLADGLCYLHDKSIKHKDLKPENILLYDDTPRGIRPIIADLGTSKIFKSGNPTDCTGGTYAYLAPEQMKSTSSTLRSDVWQLGCCFALLLAVFQHGSTGGRHLWDSIENSDGDCSCNIATEARTFMAAFDKLCGHGSVSQRRAHWLTTAMLEIDPELRFDIQTVRANLADL